MSLTVHICDSNPCLQCHPIKYWYYKGWFDKYFDDKDYEGLDKKMLELAALRPRG